MGSTTPGRVRVERGIYCQRNGKYAVCWRHAGRLRFRTVGFDVAEARRARLALIAATREGKLPVSPRLRFETVAGRWLECEDPVRLLEVGALNPTARAWPIAVPCADHWPDEPSRAPSGQHAQAVPQPPFGGVDDQHSAEALCLARWRVEEAHAVGDRAPSATR